MTVDQWFDDADLVTGPPRDRYGRPLLIPRGATERAPYTRASGLADKIGDFSFLHQWRMRYLAQGVATNYDLALLLAAEQYTTGFGLDKSDKDALRANQASGRRIDEIIERILDRRMISEKADYGTAVHAFTEPGANPPPERPVADPGHPEFDPKADTEAFWKTLTDLGIRIIGTEFFLANDELRAAGTTDHLAYVPGIGIVICDKKTSGEVHGCDFRIQLAVYAGGEIYDYETDQRTTLEEYVEAGGYDPRLLNRDVGLIWWIKGGRLENLKLDLRIGREAAQHAAWVRDNQKGRGYTNVDGQIAKARAQASERLVAQINDADSERALTDLWRAHILDWHPEHTAAAQKRKDTFA